MDNMFSDSESDEDLDTQLHDLNLMSKVLESEDLTSQTNSKYFSIGSNVPTASNITQEYSLIDKAIYFNKSCDEKLQALENHLLTRLSECRQKLVEIRNISNINVEFDKQDTFRYFNCGKPYFKDKSNFPAPDNEDTILMAKSQMYDFSQVISVPGWTVRDKSKFSTEIHKMSQDIRKTELQSKIAQIRRENKSNMNVKTEKLIKNIRKEIDRLSKKPLIELALPIDQEYDWETLSNKLDRRHTAQEYQSLWKLYFHPSINKNSWNKAQHISLQKIAQENNLQDWDDIAKKHNTNRTGYQTFVYYRTNMTNTFTGRKWTKEEIEYLKRLIDYYKEDNYIPWGKVAASMENRTKIQIYNKYFRLIEQRKGRFLPEEDSVILNCINRFGLNFKKMMSYLPGRSMIQLRMRYKVLTKMRVSAVWTVNEDKKLIQIMANQDSSMNYSNITEHFPGKDRVHLRSRYLTLVKWMKKNPNLDIVRAPRRGARRLRHGKATEDLNKAVENLKNRMVTEVEIKNSKKVTRESSEQDIEDAIVATLVNENIKSGQLEEFYEDDVELEDRLVISGGRLNMTNIKKTLILLNARLNMDIYKDSLYSKKYPGLTDATQEVSLIKFKSYSKKETVKTIQLSNYPDIWGNDALGPLNYVFPPHYATITGCRTLMMQITSQHMKDTNPININVLMRRNYLLKNQVQRLVERFYNLFVWPMILSNEGPNISAMEANNAPRNKNKNIFSTVALLDNKTSLCNSDQKINSPEKGDISVYSDTDSD